ncbi:hypothetical protein OPU71_07885 [Niveibacterium sp. 24ML]|uniref:hypothetical protein n=1 Tax=Niveibacterium sp. 24ML TaxID=2985512 RepID=UPI00226E495B|nr:hypothetical protein [Niveibacterium sp. 24ML]MCX9156044.1 hypothetical protein [Niveibacterium sp. 24ML]
MLDCVSFQLGIEPDVEAIRCVYDLDPALSDSDLAEYAYQRQRALEGGDLLPPHLMRVSHVSTLRLSGGRVAINTAARKTHGERALLASFLGELRQTPTLLCCWGDAAQQLSVLRCRAMFYRLDLTAIERCEDLSRSVFGKMSLVHLARMLGFSHPGSGSFKADAKGAEHEDRMSWLVSEAGAALALVALLRQQCMTGELTAQACESIEDALRVAMQC